VDRVATSAAIARLSAHYLVNKKLLNIVSAPQCSVLIEYDSAHNDRYAIAVSISAIALYNLSLVKSSIKIKKFLYGT